MPARCTCAYSPFLVVGLLASALLAGPVPTQASQDAAAENADTPLKKLMAAPTGLTGGETLRLEDQPEVWIHYETALELVADQEYNLAVEELDQALRMVRGERFRLLHLLAQARHGQGRTGEALALAELAAAEKPDDIDTHYLLGRWYRAAERCAEAAPHFHAAGTLAATQPENVHSSAAWYELGICLEELGYTRAAAEAYGAFDRALWEDYPAHRDAALLQGVLTRFPNGMLPRRLELLAQVGAHAECVQAAQQALSRRPEDPHFQRVYARTLIDAGRSDDALVYCRQQLEDHDQAGPSSVRFALLPLAIEAAAQAGRLEHWAEQVRGGLAGDSPAVALAERLAEHLERLGHHARAVKLWEALARRAPLNGQYQWAWANAAERGGRRDAALTILADYIRRAEDRVDLPTDRLHTWLTRVDVAPAQREQLASRKASDSLDFAEAITLGLVATAGDAHGLAGEFFVLASDQREDLALPLVVAGRAALARYDWEAAEAKANAALERSPEMVAAQLLLAESYSGRDLHDRAEAAYQAAHAAAEDDEQTLLALGQHYMSVEDLLAAQRYLHEAWTRRHQNAEALEKLVGAYLAAQKVDLARDCLKEAESADLPSDVLRRIRTELRFVENPYGPAHLAELRRQFDGHPEDVDTGLKLAAGLYMAGSMDAAQAVLDRVQAAEPENERALYVQARVHLKRLKFDPALTILEELTRRYPNRLNALDLLSTAYLSDFQVEAARKTLAHVLAQDLSAAQRREFRLDLLDAYNIFGEYEEPLRLARTWAAEEPNEPTWAFAERQILSRRGDAEQALQQVRDAIVPVRRELRDVLDAYYTYLGQLQLSPNDAAARARVDELADKLRATEGRLLQLQWEFKELAEQAGRFDLLEEEVRAWLVPSPDQRLYLQWLIEALLAQDKGEEALAAIRRYPPTEEAEVLQVYAWEARAAAVDGRLDEGLAFLDERMQDPVIKDNPLSRDQLREQKILLLLEAEAHDRALALIDAWLNELRPGAPLYPAVLTHKLNTLQAAGREAEHIEVAEQLLELRPDNPGLNNDLGYTWADRGERLEEAEAMIRKAVASEPLNAAYLDSLGWVYYKQGRFAAAREQLARATRLRLGQDPVLYDHLGDTEYRLDNTAAAKQAWTRALELAQEKPADEQRPEDAALRAALQGKLRALERDDAPATARTAKD